MRWPGGRCGEKGKAVSTVVVRRSDQPAPPEIPSGEVMLESRPEIPEVTSDGFQQPLMSLPMLAMSAGMIASMAGGSSVQYIGGGAMAIGMGGMMVGQMSRGKGERKVKLNGLRRDYL